jgi:hypothetical protein
MGQKQKLDIIITEITSEMIKHPYDDIIDCVCSI